MKFQKLFFLFFVSLLFDCSSQKASTDTVINPVPETIKSDFTIAFGSCNIQSRQNFLWREVVKNNPNLWIWGGDNIYSDTEDMVKMQRDYAAQNNQGGYADLKNSTEIIGTWDDHDYGANDAGKDYPKRAASQGLFLDFLGVAQNDPRRNREGIYHAKTYTTSKGSIKVILLDTRYFRDPITKRNGVYQPNNKGTILGQAQWSWFENELRNSSADFTIVVTSIQFLSSEHRFEKWSNFPNEVTRFKNLLKNFPSKKVLILSGDRHLSEFSRQNLTGLDYPLIDFTSSGLTHSYTNFSGEPNSNRILEVVSNRSFGLLLFNFSEKKITMQMRGGNNSVQQEHIQIYP